MGRSSAFASHAQAMVQGSAWQAQAMRNCYPGPRSTKLGRELTSLLVYYFCSPLHRCRPTDNYGQFWSAIPRSFLCNGDAYSSNSGCYSAANPSHPKIPYTQGHPKLAPVCSRWQRVSLPNHHPCVEPAVQAGSPGLLALCSIAPLLLRMRSGATAVCACVCVSVCLYV